MHYLIVDLEMTCGENISRENAETIEIGAVMVSEQTLLPISEFQTFVKPLYTPTLTTFCTELTTITQAHVDDAPDFREALYRFARWACVNPFDFCSWGNGDRKQLDRQCREFGMDNFPGRHTDLSRLAKRRLGTKNSSRALKACGCGRLGTKHRGIDDARTYAQLAPYLFK